ALRTGGGVALCCDGFVFAWDCRQLLCTRDPQSMEHGRANARPLGVVALRTLRSRRLRALNGEFLVSWPRTGKDERAVYPDHYRPRLHAVLPGARTLSRTAGSGEGRARQCRARMDCSGYSGLCREPRVAGMAVASYPAPGCRDTICDRRARCSSAM